MIELPTNRYETPTLKRIKKWNVANEAAFRAITIKDREYIEDYVNRYADQRQAAGNGHIAYKDLAIMVKVLKKSQLR